MIQDIAPHRFDNGFKKVKPSAKDYALCIRKNQVLMREGQLPRMADAEALIAGAGERAVYLFSIDEAPYFLIELKEDEFLQPIREKAETEEAGTEDAAGKDGAAKEASYLEAQKWDWKGTQYFRTMEPMYQAFAAVTAMQLWRWRESRRFCGHCGTPMKDSEAERALVCPACGQIEYPKISPAVIVAITDGERLVMSRYRDRPYRGYALIAGFVEIGETFEETVRREVMEEVGLRVKNIRYFKSQPWAFTDTEMIGFFAELDGDDTIRLQEDELSEAGWYTRDEIPDDEVTISVGSEMKMAFKYGTWRELCAK